MKTYLISEELLQELWNNLPVKIKKKYSFEKLLADNFPVEIIAEGKIKSKMIDLNAQAWDIPDFNFNKLQKYMDRDVKIFIQEAKK